MVIRALLWVDLIIASWRVSEPRRNKSHERMGSDLQSSFHEPCRAQKLGVCAVFRAGAKLHLLPRRPVRRVANISGRDGGGGFASPEKDGMEGVRDGAGGVEHICRGGAVHLQNVRDNATGV